MPKRILVSLLLVFLVGCSHYTQSTPESIQVSNVGHITNMYYITQSVRAYGGITFREDAGFTKDLVPLCYQSFNVPVDRVYRLRYHWTSKEDWRGCYLIDSMDQKQ